MRKSLALIVFFVLLGLWFARNHATPPDAPPAQPSHVDLPAARPSSSPSPSLNLAMTRVPEPPEANSPSSFAPKGNLIEFKVVHGLAIAYGDILIGKPTNGSTIDHGYAEAPVPQRWDRPEIPYVINTDLPNPARVESALDYFRNHTPVRFVPYTNQRDALVFEPGEDNCYSSLGRTGGLQPIRLAPGCQSQEIMHEVMHALGFVHEQSRPDRDQFVEILWPNIDEKYQAQFAVVPETMMEAERDFPFDYHSIMLYQPGAFATKPGLVTLRSKGADPVSPVNAGLSESDIRRLNRLYGS